METLYKIIGFVGFWLFAIALLGFVAMSIYFFFKFKLYRKK